MTDSVLQSKLTELTALCDLLTGGYKAGRALQDLENGSLKSLGAKLKAFVESVGEMAVEGHANLLVGVVGNSEAASVCFVAPEDLEITEVRLASSGIPTSDPLLTASNKPAGESAVNLLAAANYDMAGLVAANTSVAMTLSATAANKQMAAGDVLTFAVTCDSGDAIVDAAISVKWKRI